MLGIPTVLDRFIQQMWMQALTPIGEPGFGAHSYGFRPGRQAADAVRAAQRYAEQGQDWDLDALDRELERRGHAFSRYADDCNIYVGSQAAAERVKASLQEWIEKHLRLQVHATKSGVGRIWERKFLGFRLNRARQIEAAAESLERFQAKVREKWRSCQSVTSNQTTDAWRQSVRGWWGYYRLAENRRPIYRLEGWIRRHIRKCFWLRWHEPEGRERRLRSLGLRGRLLKVAQSHRGAWHLAGTGSLQSALSNATLRRHGFLMPSDLAGN